MSLEITHSQNNDMTPLKEETADEEIQYWQSVQRLSIPRTSQTLEISSIVMKLKVPVFGTAVQTIKPQNSVINNDVIANTTKL
ncbi:hypothetical protein EAF00_001269 [Botryotinia globosa]|nr:hypothetical protein EAF00_001269 [Botryotinia globosa]